VRSALAVAAIIAAGLGVSAIAIRLGDRGTLAAPPDAVLESFARDLAERRFDLAPKYLSRELKRSARDDTIRDRYAPRLEALGGVNGVDAELEWMDRDRAAATATIRAGNGSVMLGARLVWERGGWLLEALPDLQPALTPRAPPSMPR
jgi:hypothetical protein